MRGAESPSAERQNARRISAVSPSFDGSVPGTNLTDDEQVTRRAVVSCVIACLLAAVSALVLPTREAASWRETFSPQLLAPSGADAVGVRRTLLGTGADDPWNPGHQRVVMVDIHYPASAGEHPLRHYLRSQHMSELAMLAWAPSHERRLGLHEDEVNWLFITHSYEWAPPRHGNFPVIVISAPEDGMRTSLTALAEDLAGHGFIVVTVDHPYDAPVVELWPTREVIEAGDAEREPTDQAADRARANDLAAVADGIAALDDEIDNVIAPECVLVVSGDLQDQAAALTDEPMIEAQISAHYPRVARTLGTIPSLAQSEHEFRVKSAGFRNTVASLLAQDPRC
jgi:hypothetical protein